MQINTDKNRGLIGGHRRPKIVFRTLRATSRPRPVLFLQLLSPALGGAKANRRGTWDFQFFRSDPACCRGEVAQPATMGGEPMTERLYYTDSYLREFRARVVERSGDGRTIYLDRTLFYPTSGGQPFDTGSLGGVAVVDVVDEEERIAHLLAAPLASDGAVEVAGAIDWDRRFDHMQQHSGQHLLSAIFQEVFHLHTASFHLGAESSTIDLDGGALDARTLAEAERRGTEPEGANRPPSVQVRGPRRS